MNDSAAQRRDLLERRVEIVYLEIRQRERVSRPPPARVHADDRILGAGLPTLALSFGARLERGTGQPRPKAARSIGVDRQTGSLEQGKMGDLVVWSGHVAMAVGNGQMIEAGDPVQISHLRTANIGMAFLGFYRPTG